MHDDGRKQWISIDHLPDSDNKKKWFQDSDLFKLDHDIVLPVQIITDSSMLEIGN